MLSSMNIENDVDGHNHQDTELLKNIDARPDTLDALSIPAPTIAGNF
jgi:hypothetical protein